MNRNYCGKAALFMSAALGTVGVCRFNIAERAVLAEETRMKIEQIIVDKMQCEINEPQHTGNSSV